MTFIMTYYIVLNATTHESMVPQILLIYAGLYVLEWQM